jgi:nitrite reductase (NADH) small subunit
MAGLGKRYLVCVESDLPEGSHQIVTAGATEVGVYNVRGQLYALTNVCPHAGAPLCLGRVSGTTSAGLPYAREWVLDGQVLLCPWHGWEFDMATGRPVADYPGVQPVQRWQVSVEDGSVWIGRMRRDALPVAADQAEAHDGEGIWL